MKIDGLEIAGTDTHATRHKLHDGSTLAIVNPPMRGEDVPTETHVVAEPVRHAANAFAALDLARGAAAKDQTLSDFGRKAKIAGVRTAASEAVQDASAKLDAMAETIERLEAEAYAPPKLEAGDVEGALIDQEIRNYVRGLSGKAQAEYLKSLGAQPRHVAALMRSPVPMGAVSEMATRLHRESRQNSQKAISANAYASAVEWARMTLDQLRRLM